MFTKNVTDVFLPKHGTTPFSKVACKREVEIGPTDCDDYQAS